MGEDSGAGVLEGSHTKSGVPIQHLDYRYVEGCKNAKELEKILKVLRSGEEGHYPELIEFTEKKLEEVNPKSKSLRKELPIKTYYDLSKEEKQGITDDLQEWVETIDQADKSLKDVTHTGKQQNGNLPPVRCMGNSQSSSSHHPQQMKTVKNVRVSAVPRGYHEWDKFDPDKEIEVLDHKEVEERKRKQEKTGANHTEAIPSKVNFEAKSETERNILATREKEKGNEAFQSGHYMEALLYYSRSIQLDPTAAAVYNNRAIAEIKLEKFQEAIKDCDAVLSMEPNNVKAYLRRAIAHRKEGKNEEAKTDLFRVLAIEPNNKRAKELLSELEKTERSSQVESSPSTANQSDKERKTPGKIGQENVVPGSGSNAKKGRRLKIVEVEGDSREEPAQILNGESCAVEESKPHADDLNPEHKINRTIENVTATQPMEATELLQLPVLVERAQNEGTRFFKLGRYAEAAEKYTEAIEILLKDKFVYRTAVSSILCNRASCLGRMGDCGGCIADCTAALELVPSSVRPLIKRAEAYETSEKYKKAWLDYRSALKIQPQSTTALQGNFRVSKLLESLYGSNWKQEVEPPDSSQVIIKSSATQNRCESSSTTPLPPKAVNVVTPTQPNDNTTTQTGGASGMKNSAQGNVREATSAAHPTPETKTPSTNLDLSVKFSQFKDRGNEFVRQGRLQDAVTCYTECINIDSKSVAVYTNRALCYVRLNKHDLAIQDTTEALTLQPDNVKALFRRALAKKGLGQYDSAARDLLQLQKIEPKNAAAKKELEFVLNMCREERRATAEKATEAKKKESSKKPKQQSQPETQSPENLQWKRIAIRDVQRDEEDDDTSDVRQERLTPTKPSPVVTSNHSGQNSMEKTVKLLKNTAYDFYQAWNSVKKDNTKGHADLLRQLGSRSLARVLSNKLDAPMFNRIVAALSEEMLSNGEESLAYSILQQLCHVQRFDMVLLFMSAKEKNELRDLFSKLEAARDQQNFVSSTGFVRLTKNYKM